MLSDAIRELRERVKVGAVPDSVAGLLLTFRAFELEARNMEERIELLTGRPHVALDGHLVSAPVTIFGFDMGREVHHGS
ncbi:hypothetical protein HB780_05605 (plasmid) [Rhizobium lusitanum]|uniref:hypothetical protein n=1 Tax=Rhizobium lusitanum TaxID=293958 RepID=UPI00160E9442|nr:hypothetical protein [Rhizobium lusitanum]QND45231.1 hypothetical protein HB780_05605 [Rhizobium lusitanum]